MFIEHSFNPSSGRSIQKNRSAGSFLAIMQATVHLVLQDFLSQKNKKNKKMSKHVNKQINK